MFVEFCCYVGMVGSVAEFMMSSVYPYQYILTHRDISVLRTFIVVRVCVRKVSEISRSSEPKSTQETKRTKIKQRGKWTREDYFTIITKLLRFQNVCQIEAPDLRICKLPKLHAGQCDLVPVRTV